MSGLFASLNSSVKALNAHSRAIETTGKNLANVNNSAYARQRVIYGDRGTVQTPHGAQSLGLEVLAVQQLRDALIDRQYQRELSLSGSYTAEQSAYQRAQAALGETIDRASDTDTGIGAAMDDLFSAFQSLASRPTDAGERASLLQKASILTDRFQLADTRLAQVQSDLNAQVATDVSDVNRLLQTISELNTQIGRFEITQPGSAVDLRDQRQARIEELAGKINFNVVDGGNGQINLVVKDSTSADVVLLDRGVVTGPVTFDGVALSGGSPAAVLAPASGSIQGALAARDGAVQTLRDDLDRLASQIVTTVNDAYNPTGLTGNFFTATGLTAGTIALDPALNATNLKASDGGAAGDNSVALAVAALASQKFTLAGGDAFDGTFGGFYSQTVASLGQALAGANARAEDQLAITELVRGQRDSVSGVSLDEELADLTRFQRAFQASSRVFSIVDNLLDEVVNRLGR
ncbi:MAG TPA: flagellar hook-associated protein FlgK [Opitutaceae bacterium]